MRGLACVIAGSSPHMRGTLQCRPQRHFTPGIIPAYAGNTCRAFGFRSILWDHPRICGEHGSFDLTGVAGTGSSPHMRGTRRGEHVGQHRQGIIPAYAGNTYTAYKTAIEAGDHPRICGEHFDHKGETLQAQGSSPHMRGTLPCCVRAPVARGIIPAYAGNTILKKRWNSSVLDHPRICGEHITPVGFRPVRLGSSPHMRGTHGRRGRRRVRPGIIPAYAGNTISLLLDSWMDGDHPRICGEHQIAALMESGGTGSSPHMRGTPATHLLPHAGHGIIPAYAGNTKRFYGSALFHRDHPRICGEHQLKADILNTYPGSSPHMRGTPMPDFEHWLDTGIIPAYAGNTCYVTLPRLIVWDHPRICGEHFSAVSRISIERGSSPHMRGTLQRRIKDIH